MIPVEIPNIAFVDQCTFIEFVRVNTTGAKYDGADWNNACRFVSEKVMNYDHVAYAERSDFADDNRAKDYDPDYWKWMKAFFDAHPKLQDKVYFVFTD